MLDTISLKLDKGLLKEIDANLKKHRYSTRTEFFRDMARQKLTEWQKEEMLQAVKKLRGWSKLKTTDEELHKIREKVARELLVEHNIK